MKKFAHHFSRYGDQNQLLHDFLIKDNIVGIKDVDTRELIGYIRENGAQNAVISSEDKSIDELKELLVQAPNMKGLELASKVSTKETYECGSGKYRVALIDYGVKEKYY